jgi:starch synthase
MPEKTACGKDHVLMKVLFVSSEALPYAASGGLADVAGSLPSALRKRVVGCRVVMPLYQSVSE